MSSTEQTYGELRSLAEARDRFRGGSSGGVGGGSEPPDNMNDRIEKLEAGYTAIMAKLDGIASSIADSRMENEKRFASIEGRLDVMDAKLDAKADKASVASLEGKVNSVKDAIDTRASQAELNLLKGKVDTLPTTLQLLGFVLAVFVAAGVTRLFGH